MTIRKFIIVCLLLFPLSACLGSFSYASEKEVRLTSCNWAPYNGEQLINYGFTAEIITEAFKRMGYRVSYKFLPWKRAIYDTKQGKYDGVFSAYYSEERAKAFAYSDHYATGPLVFCSRRSLDIHYKKLRDLMPYRIGVVNDYVNTKEFDQATYLRKEGVTSDIQNIRKLMIGRLDLIVIDKYLAIYHLKNSPMIEGDL